MIAKFTVNNETFDCYLNGNFKSNKYLFIILQFNMQY